ncbi:MAG TPA: two-component regulator propeller domain-containing protein [Puia sp.]|nr:two-component regulator propeller domain-containing protein [Puia sp.]
MIARLLIVLLLMVTIHPNPANGQPEATRKFSQLTTADGLSQSAVNCILKDKLGFMWFGTRDGLNKYDGHTFTVYRNNPKNSRSIPDNQIKCLFEDQQSNLWIGTLGGGLCIYNRNQDAFIRLEDMGIHPDFPINPAILSICEDHESRLWVGTFHELLLIDPNKKTIRHFQPDPHDPASLSNPTIQAIFEDASHNLWIGTSKGLDLWNPKDSTFRHFWHDDKDPRSLSSNLVKAITEDRHGRLWIGTDGGGLNVFDRKQGAFTCYKKDPTQKNSLSSNLITTLCRTDGNKIWVGSEDALDLLNVDSGTFLSYKKTLIGQGSLNNNSILSLQEDNNGILWVGTSAGGINKYDRNLFSFDCYRNTSDPFSLSADMITSFAEDQQGDIWIGTDGGGLNRWERNNNRFFHYYPSPGNKNALGGSAILSLLISRKKDYLWIGTYGNGLNRLDLKTGRFQHYLSGTGPHDLSNASIYALLEDPQGNIWMGTNGGGVNVLHPPDGSITKHRHTDDQDSLSNDFIRSMHQDRQGKIWIGTYSGGISVYDPVSGKFALYDKVNNNLSNQVVFSLCEDAKGNIWAGTMGGGLDWFDPKTHRFVTFNEENGLNNNIVNSIVEDAKGYLWLSTNKGISRFNPLNRTFRNYGVYNGLQDLEFIVGSGYRTANGRIFFGGVNGFNVFDPGAVRDNKIPPVSRLTGFLLFNKPVGIGEKNSPLKENIEDAKEITLTYDQSDFTIEYAALSYTVPSENKYAYQLEGFDKNWNYAGSERKATYTNLVPGRYLFKVRAANNDGIWNPKETTLTIIITPPFWKTWWAYGLYMLLIALILYIIYKDIADKEKLKGQVRFERLTADKMQELNRIKLNFFTNVSHELRTPLSLIMDPLRKIIREELPPEQVKKYSGLMYNNASRLMKLINQMLDLRKLEAGHAKLAARPANIVTATKNIATLFNIHAVERNIHYSITASTDNLPVWIDQDKFEKIIFNLISNAFKYTPDNGSISILISLANADSASGAQASPGYVTIHVRDTGVGIPAHLKDKVFEIFYQVEETSRFEHGSTGIGLALTKELVELHKGRIEVESELGRGSDFIIYLPLGHQHLTQSEQSAITEPDIAPDPADPSSQDPEIIRPADEPELHLESTPLILLVEDNKDLREYLKEELGQFYKVDYAPNGSIGYEKAVTLIPDLIISDIMMPEITGLQLCEKIKTDERTSHIPVILLTAKQAEAHQIEGYSAGADAYIPKPFNTELVLARIRNLLASRKKLRELYGKEPVSDDQGGLAGHAPSSPDLEMNPLDKEFIDKAIRIVKDNLADITFDIDILSAKLKVSRRQLYRKLKALTDQTAHDFVTTIRLKKAAELLVTGEYSIAEVAYKVGFSEPANFSRSFTRQFGKSPKKYIAEYDGK